MWLKLFLLTLVALAYADRNAAWRDNHVYVYEIQGRILTSLNQITSTHSGILLRAKLTIRPRPDGHLGATITSAEYANIHSELSDFIDQVPESQLSYEELPLSTKPFRIEMDNGVVKDIVVNKDITNWEANIIKGIVSHLQLDTDADNQIPSFINTFTQEQNNAVFKTMEKTVHGEMETLYEIHPVAEELLQSDAWVAPLRELKQTGDWIEIVKSKNFTHSKETPSYYYGFQGISDFDVKNEIGELLTRHSGSRAIVSGSLQKFTLHSILSTDTIAVSPTLTDKETGAVQALFNMTLSSLKPILGEPAEVTDPINVGIVYHYDHPFDESNTPEARTKRMTRGVNPLGSGEDTSEEFSAVQEHPHIHEAPASPLLPLTVGYNGQSISKQQNIKEIVRTLAKKIGQEYLKPDSIPKENTVGKFLMLTSLIKVMNHVELKYVSGKLYTDEKHGEAAVAWYAYRDAVAEAGTGPALLSIDEFIRNGKISGAEAGHVVSTIAISTRQPTEKYIKKFWGLIESTTIMQQKYLNESLLLSFTTLCHDVYVDAEHSHNKYPVHSFGTFNTAQGRLFVEKDVVPYLATRLNEAIKRSDTAQIHLYIRALGNLGHRQILSVFKPYLEGTKKASQFQRVLMVLSLETLLKHDQLVARNVLYRIYQNVKDSEHVRVSAVFQLMRTRPSGALLQSMATLSHIDPNNHVNSAVKSAIESAANIQAPQYADLREAAQSALPLLPSRDFGLQNCKQYLKMYVLDQLQQLGVKQLVETQHGGDSIVPRGVHYWLRGTFGGYEQNILRVQSLVTSVEDLVNVYEQQTKSYRTLLREKKSYESVKTKWSSEHTAQLLGVQNEQREQLESFLFMRFASLQKVWSFDNHTMNNLTEIVREWEEEFKNSKHIDYHKMAVYSEMAIAVPNSWGLPFYYTFDRPALAHLESDVKVVAKPTFYSDQGLQRPDKIDIEFQVSGFVSVRDQSLFGFFAPFNSKRYTAGYDKNFQVQVPKIGGKVHLDVENKQLTLELENKEEKRVSNLIHFSTWPYTGQTDIYSLKPENKIIRSEKPQQVNKILGLKQTGIALEYQLESDEVIDTAFLYRHFLKQDVPSTLLAPWLSEKIQHVKLSVNVDTLKSTSSKVIAHLGHQRKSTTSSRFRVAENIKSASKVSQESWDRQKEVLKNTAQGIVSARARVVDAVILFDGEKSMKYSTTLAGASSSIDPKGRVMMQAAGDNKQDQPIKVEITADSQTLEPPSLNVDSALAFDPTTTVNLTATIVEKTKTPGQVTLKLKLTKSDERKEHLKQSTTYKQCQHQMQEGNHQLPSCAHLTTEANLLDQFNLSLVHKDLHPSIVNATYKAYSVLRHYLYPRITENIQVAQNLPAEGRVQLEGQFNPRLTALNASVQVDRYGHVEIRNLPVNSYFKHLLVHHPSYPVPTRLVGQSLNYLTYRPTCVLDKKAVNTLDNKTYPVALENDWVVLLHYVPRRPSPAGKQYEIPVVEQLNEMTEGFIVYTRASGTKEEKEVKIVIQSQNTISKVIAVTIKPSESGGYPRLFVQNEQISYDRQGRHMYDDYMQVYKLPNNEMKVDIYDIFEVIYDGTRAKIVLSNDKLRDASRGLCGTFTGEPETDFTHPGNCIIQNPDVFVATNTVPEQQRTKRMNDMLMIQAEEKKCYQKSIGYVPVVAGRDIDSLLSSVTKSNIRFQTKYVEVEDMTCFTMTPVAVCKPGYSERSVSKSMPVHCLKASNVVDLMKKQVDQGANLSLENKTPNKDVMMTVAESCEM